MAALLGEPAKAEVEELLRSPSETVGISAVNLAEVVDALVRGRGHPQEDVGERLDWLEAGGLRIEPVSGAIGRLAGAIRAVWYERDRRPISMADCIGVATARVLGARLATSDPAQAETARRVGVEVIPLPDSAGVRP